VEIIDDTSASSTWFETNWSAPKNYSSSKGIDIILNSGDLKLHYGKGLLVADIDNHRIVKTMMGGGEWATYGSVGSGTGQFNRPCSISYDINTGYIYIADAENHRIVKTKINGSGWTTYGSFGAGTGQFKSPMGIFFDNSTGYVYVTDHHNGRIVKTMMDGSGWTTYGSWGSGVGQFMKPYGIDYDSSSEFIYVSDQLNHRIVKTKINGSGWTTNGSYGFGKGNFNWNTGISYDRDTEYVYVTNMGTCHFVKTKMNGSGWIEYANWGSNKQLYNPNHINYDNNTEYIYIADSGNHRIVKTKINGSGWTTYGSKGSGTEQFSNPWDVEYCDNHYCAQGYLTSKKFDYSSPANLLTLNWVGDTPAGTSIKFQLRTAHNSTALSLKDFVGPNGSSSGYYTKSGLKLWSGHDGDQWIQYKAYLSTNDLSTTPILRDVTITYNLLPYRPILTGPVNNSWVNNNKPTFTWTFIDTDSASQDSFQWLMDDISDFGSIDYDSKTIISTNPSFMPASLISDGIWYWRVRTEDSDNGWGPYSLPWMVQIDTQPPSSNISVPKNNGYYKEFDIIRGTAIDPGVATGVNRIELGIIRLKDNKYWDGSTWTSETSWLLTNGTMKWEYDSKGVTWTSKEQYRILSRGIDNATNLETPGDGIIITFDTDCPISTIIIPQNNSYHNVLNSISGTSTDISGSGVKKVEIAIKQTNDDNYWNGQTWVAAKSWLNVDGTNDWIYDSSSVMWTSGVQYIIFARSIDWLNNIEVTTTGTRIIIDKDSPISQVIHPGTGMFLNQLDLITGNASDHNGSGLDRIEISIRRDSDRNYWDGATWQSEISWITAQGTDNWTYKSDEIPWTTDSYNTIFSNAIDKMENKLPHWKGNTFMFDNKPPEQSFTINNNAKFTNSLELNLTLESEDSGSGVALMTFSNDGQKWFTWEPIDNYKLFNVPSGEGVKDLYFKVQDRAGNIADPVTNSIILDSTPPECSITINKDAIYTNSYGVFVDLNATDELSGVDMMAFSFDHKEWTIWKHFKPNEKLTLPSNEGKNIVYFRVRDKAGNIGEVNDTIILDTIPPQSLSIVINNAASETDSKEVILKLNAIDRTSGLDQMSFSTESTVWSEWEDYSNSTTFNLTAENGEITIYFRVKDKAGNIANPTIDSITFIEPVQLKKTDQEQLNYWYLILIIIIITIIIISFVIVLKRRKKAKDTQEKPTGETVTIKPGTIPEAVITVGQVPPAPTVAQLPETTAPTPAPQIAAETPKVPTLASPTTTAPGQVLETQQIPSTAEVPKLPPVEDSDDKSSE
jgi:hypothetical protein